jgi:peptidoglycan/xylan/chitin deacetylase (PgdA/CDA1 family)
VSRLTVLMYHQVDQIPPATRYASNYVTPKRFVEQVDALLGWGYTPITFDEWIGYRNGAASLPRWPLIITFDDGYTCFERNAWPVLQARGIRPWMFLVAGEVGGTNRWDAEGVPQPLLDAPRIRALQGEGVRFGAHGLRHVPLGRVPVTVAKQELAESRSILEDVLGEPVTTFAYPYSNQNRAVRELARETGYTIAVRGKGRMNDKRTDLYGMRRILMHDEMTVRRLKWTLARLRWMTVT